MKKVFLILIAVIGFGVMMSLTMFSHAKSESIIISTEMLGSCVSYKDHITTEGNYVVDFYNKCSTEVYVTFERYSNMNKKFIEVTIIVPAATSKGEGKKLNVSGGDKLNGSYQKIRNVTEE